MKILLLDWTNLLYRSYFSSKDHWMTNKRGEPSGAYFLSINSFQKIKKSINFDPKIDKVIFTFDVKTSKIPRLEKFPMYKGTRNKMEDQDFFKQIEMFKKTIKFSWYDIFAEDYLEADDICWILVKWLKNNKSIDHIYVYSNDRDYFQFLNEKVTMIRPWFKWILNQYNFEDYNKEYQSITNEQFIDLKAIVWDSSDNIIWIKSLWDKSGIKILKEYWNLENWMNSKNIEKSIKKLPKWLREIVIEEDKGFDTIIDWYKNKDWTLIKDTIRNILLTNRYLAKLNYKLDWVPNEVKDKLKNKLTNLFKWKRNNNEIQWYLNYYDIKKIIAENV